MTSTPSSELPHGDNFVNMATSSGKKKKILLSQIESPPSFHRIITSILMIISLHQILFHLQQDTSQNFEQTTRTSTIISLNLNNPTNQPSTTIIKLPFLFAAAASSASTPPQQANLAPQVNSLLGHLSQPHTTYACEGNKLNLNCQDGKLIHLVRAIYGRFSLSICNEQGHSTLSVNCASFKAFLQVESRCNKHSNCSVPVSKEIFGDPCEGTSKYLEVQYYCDDGLGNQQAGSRSPPSLARPNEEANALAVPNSPPPSQPASPKEQAHPVGRAATPRTQAPAPEPEAPLTAQPPSTVIQAAQQPAPQRVCAPQVSQRSLLWNYTRPGHLARQPCPEGSSGKASWLCDAERLRFAPLALADLSQCRSNWIQRLAQQLDELLNPSQSHQPGVQPTGGLELALWQAKLMLSQILRDMELMARNKELFSDDLRRIEIMMSQIVGHFGQLTSASSSPLASDSWYQASRGIYQQQQGGALSQLHGELFTKLAFIVSHLFESLQRNAWLEMPSSEQRRALETRLLTHLRYAGLMYAASLPAQEASVRRANVVASINVIDRQEAGDDEFVSLKLSGSPDNVLGAGDENEQLMAAELKVQQSLLRDLYPNAAPFRLLVIGVKKPDYGSIRQQLEEQTSSQMMDPLTMSLMPSLDQQPSVRIFGVFAADNLQQEAQAQGSRSPLDLLAQWPVSVHFKLGPGHQQQAQQASLCQAVEPNNRCHHSVAASNATDQVCQCQQLGFVAFSLRQQQPLVGGEWDARQNELAAASQQLDGPEVSGSRAAGAQQPAQQPQQQQLGLWTLIFLLVGLTLFVLALGGFVINGALRLAHGRASSKPAKKQSFLTSGASILGHHQRQLSGGPTTGPLAGDLLITAGAEPLTSQSSSQPSGQSSALGLASHTASYKSQQQLYASHYPPLDAASLPPATNWFSPRRWLMALGRRAASRRGPAHLASVQHQVLNGTLMSAHAGHYQNGYTSAGLHQSRLASASLAAQLPIVAPSSSTSSYVSSSAYYEEIGPTGLAAGRPTHTIVEPFKQQPAMGQGHFATMAPAGAPNWQHQRPANYLATSHPASMEGQKFVAHQDLSHMQQQQQQQADGRSSFMFASPNNQNVYKINQQQTMQQNGSHQLVQHQNQHHHYQQQQRMMPN